MPIINTKDWDIWVEKNQNSAGKVCIDIARQVMKVLDEDKDFNADELIVLSAKEIKAEVPNKFIKVQVANMVSKYHSRGTEFRKKWNEAYGQPEEEPKKPLQYEETIHIG